MKDPNKFKNAIIEKTKQAMDGASRKSTSTSLDKVRPQNQVGQRIQQTQSPPPKFKQDPNIADKYSIFDKWVEFRDKYLAGNVNDGFRKAGYTGKFLFNSLINSNVANNLKQKAVDEASNLKNKAKSGELFSFSDKKENQYADTTSSGSWKETIKEKFGQSAEVAKEKFGQGAEFAKGKAQEAYVYGKEVGKEQLSKGAEVAKDKLGQGAEIAKEKLGQGAEIAKEKLGQGAEFAKGKAQEAYVYGKEVGSEQLSKGAEVAKDKLGQGAGFAKEKLGQGAQAVKDKVQEEYAQRRENISNYSKESLRSATENVSKTASSAYDSVKSVPINATNKIYKFGKRTAILVFAGATVVAFAFAAGRQLPIAYFNYQLKKQQMESQNDGSEERPIKTERSQ